MRVFDASSLIYAWDNYPYDQFPGLWAWLEVQVTLGLVLVPYVALEEVRNKTPDCYHWLKQSGVTVIEPSTSILSKAFAIGEALQVTGGRYGGGVGENDIIIIATAAVYGCTLVSNERRQITLPQKKSSYRIPAVCNLLSPKVLHINFLEFIKESAVKF